MQAPITVLTVSIPGREALLAENVASVNAQTIPVTVQLVCSHPVGDEQAQVQYARAKNSLLPAVQTPWVAVLNDDDSWLPHHVETVLPHLHNADVVYSWDADGHKPRENCNDWTIEALCETFARTNFIDGNCLIRRSALEAVGGFPTDWQGPGPWDGGHYAGSIARWLDWRTWQLLAGQRARFKCVPVATWRYGKTPGQICG
jgi:hypothetical protein